jgi:hypothetical protein
MKTMGQKLLTNTSPVILLILISILYFPGFSFATMPKPGPVGKPQRIEDPQRLQNAMRALLQKAYAQQKIINGWHRKARLETARMEAKEREESAKALAAASRRACQIQLAMARSPEDITIPGCRFKSKTH